MSRELPRILLAATKSGSGKTTITCGLLQALMDRGITCNAWKCGPDYIDPMFHKYVLGAEGGNLDSFFLEEEEVRAMLSQRAGQGSMAVIEGVMGYFDGIAGVSTQASSYDIAKITETPVILIVDCKGASLSVAAIIQGFLEFQETACIRGVLLNRISSVMAKRLKPVIERLGVPVVGWIPECEEMKLESRHLGLVQPEDIPRLKQQIEALARQICQTVDLDAITAIARTAPDLEKPKTQVNYEVEKISGIRIGVAGGPAFRFYYQENMKLLERLGAELIPFDPMMDEDLPEGIQGVLLGGGYPELYARTLGENTRMCRGMRQACSLGMPYLAECGGFLYLHEELEDCDGRFWPMAGVIKGKARKTNKLSRFGYVALETDREDSCLKGSVKGHEFHYWDSEDCGSDWLAKKPLSDRSWSCMHEHGYQIGGFPHLYYPSNPGFLVEWLNGCKAYGIQEGIK